MEDFKRSRLQVFLCKYEPRYALKIYAIRIGDKFAIFNDYARPMKQHYHTISKGMKQATVKGYLSTTR